MLRGTILGFLVGVSLGKFNVPEFWDPLTISLVEVSYVLLHTLLDEMVLY